MKQTPRRARGLTWDPATHDDLTPMYQNHPKSGGMTFLLRATMDIEGDVPGDGILLTRLIIERDIDVFVS